MAARFASRRRRLLVPILLLLLVGGGVVAYILLADAQRRAVDSLRRSIEMTPAPAGLADALAGMRNVFINLDARTDRRARVEAMFRAAGLAQVERFPAIKHYRGHIGCNKSHLAVLRAAEARGEGVVVWEDDAGWNDVDHEAVRTVPRLRALLAREYDVILLCASGSAAYIVAPHYVRTLAANLAEGTRLFEETGDIKYAFDRHWNVLRNKDAWFVVHLVRQLPGHSDIAGSLVTYPREYIETPNV